MICVASKPCASPSNPVPTSRSSLLQACPHGLKEPLNYCYWVIANLPSAHLGGVLHLAWGERLSEVGAVLVVEADAAAVVSS